MGFFQNLFGGAPAADLSDIIGRGALLVDVREPAEFAGGSAKGAINIPLGSVALQLQKLKSANDIVVFCRSGARSGQAKTILQQNGFTNVVNGGTWENVSRLVK
ncbi:MAG: rhodanese-like domain-containing protein [Bacteroidetes bacterium]|nr:MAG: rhodanese-like domain-containing protein [Bacteroidota bacterium]